MIDRILASLKQVAGVRSARLFFFGTALGIYYDPRRTDPDAIQAALPTIESGVLEFIADKEVCVCPPKE